MQKNLGFLVLIVSLFGATCFAEGDAVKKEPVPITGAKDKKSPFKKLSDLVGQYSELKQGADKATSGEEKTRLNKAATEVTGKILSGLQSGEFGWEHESTPTLQWLQKMMESKEVQGLNLDLSSLKEKVADRLARRRQNREDESRPRLFKKGEDSEKKGLFRGRRGAPEKSDTHK